MHGGGHSCARSEAHHGPLDTLDSARWAAGQWVEATMRPDGLDVAFPTDSNGKEGRVWPLDTTCKLRMDSVATDASVSVFGKDSLSLR